MWDGDTPAERAQLAQGLLALDIAERDRKREDMVALLTKSGALTEAAQVNLDQLKMLDEETDRLAMRAIVEERSLAEARDQLQHDREMSDTAVAMMRNRLDLAGTEEERYQINLQILAAEQELERKVKEAAIRADGVVSPEEQDDWNGMVSRQESDAAAMVERRIAQRREEFRSFGNDFVDAIKEGDLGSFMADEFVGRFEKAGWNLIFDTLFEMMGNFAYNRDGPQNNWGSGRSGILNNIARVGFEIFSGGGRASGGDVKPGFHYRMAEHGTPELLMLGGQGQVANMAQVAAMVKSSGMGVSDGSGRGDVNVSATYAPQISVKGSGPEIDALRRELAAERANFRTNVVATVNDALQRRLIS